MALMHATFDMLREVGYERMSIDAIAARAGVGKTTIYRWYDTKEELVIEALTWVAQEDDGFVPHNGSLASDFEAIIQNKLEHDPLHFDRSACARTFSALAGSQELAKTYWDLYINQRREAFRAALSRAKERGEISVDLDHELFLDVLQGYILFGLLVRPKGAVTPKAINKVVRRLLAGFQ